MTVEKNEASPIRAAKVFGSNVFNDAVMRERLPKSVYKSLKKAISGETPLALDVANVVANAMKDWAIEKNATHYCHWFQPMTGLTAEKHDPFISPTADGSTLLEFSGKQLIQGEPDASSFPSGGLRATFEARGYTAWDCTSPVFIKEDGNNVTLFIPSAFCSYTGCALDKKTPLLRSMDTLNKQSIRVLKALGNTTSSRVTSTLGPEQEYFLIDKKFYDKRLDLIVSGRTLFGAPSPRGQEMDDHYFGSLHERIASFMAELNTELWKLGVTATTQHNEVSPAQYEVAPVYGTVNVATDHNQLTMETLQKVALRQGLVCLLHEKPFAGVNGSGKHNNWSIVTDDGINLLDPGSTPHENMSFLVFLCATVKAVDKYAKLLRASVANTGNEHRLGANEAPPAIVSVFLGDQLTDIFEQLAIGTAKSSRESGELKLGISTLPPFHKDCTDRNRTSPFAFTGNRFEFRMPGSTQSCSGVNFTLNTVVAEILSEIADELEKAEDVKVAAQKILGKITTEHKRIVFNGDNYTKEWVEEAARRGLPNITSSVESLQCLAEKDFVEVFAKHGVLSNDELHARQEILLESYAMTLNIEAMATLDIAKRQILPVAVSYSSTLGTAAQAVKAAGVSADAQIALLKQTCDLINSLKNAIEVLEVATKKSQHENDVNKKAALYRDEVVPAMGDVRLYADELEKVVDASLWPLPTYAQMLFLK
ncbi:MAG: glutamine synthetase III [Phycisphaerae bacterium]|nr:glutamine synthetase III [Phycisphaerae bacterium]